MNLASRLVDPRTVAIAVLVGFLSAAYIIYDIACPNHFVGDMYGLEVLFRLPLVAIPTVLLLGVAIVLSLFLNRLSTGGRLSGSLVALALAFILLVLALYTARSRSVWAAREAYPNRSVEELLRLAREKNDQFAIDALGIKRDPAAVPGLLELLLDETKIPSLRIVSAHALGLFRDESATTALKEAKTRVRDPLVLQHISFALNEPQR